MKASNNYQMDYTYSNYGAGNKTKAGGSPRLADAKDSVPAGTTFSETISNQVETNKTTYDELKELIQQRKEDFLNKLKSGETQPSFQIGAITMTEEEWDNLLVKTDIAIDQIKEEEKDSKETNKEKVITQEMITELLKDKNKSYDKKLDESNEDVDDNNDDDDESDGNKSETDSNIIVKADGSRVLEVTMNIGGTQTTMCLEISKPTNFINEVNKNDEMKKNNQMNKSNEVSGETQLKI